VTALRIAGRMVRTDRIEQVLMPDAHSAAVWLIGRDEPLHARADELAGVHRYVCEAMSDDGVTQ
jgi:DNA polymerase III psi subunit